jgi:hypothetical protein
VRLRRLAFGGVTTHSALAAAATLVSLAFAGCTFERWIDRRKPHELAWSVALGLFAGGAAALWWGAATGWTPFAFRVFYALGAVVDVPVLALGTVLLLARPRPARAAAIVVGLFGAFAIGVVLAAPVRGHVPVDELPRGSEVFGALPRVLAAAGSSVGALVLVGGALASALRLARRRGPGRLVVANVLIALGTVLLGAGGLLNSAVDEMTGFAISLVAGISAIFAGFLLTSPRPTGPAPAARAITASTAPTVHEVVPTAEPAPTVSARPPR